MTPKQILDSFSETLVRDERILSTGERALVTTLLQHARAATGENQEIQEAVRTVIASAIGETVAQRAFAVLGGSIVERILLGDSLPLGDSAEERPAEIYAREPQPPSGPGPHVKAPPKAPQPPASPMRTPGEPQPPSGPGPHVKAPPKAPQPPASPMRTPGEPQPPSGPGPHAVRTVVVSETSAAVAERPSALPARCVVLDEFLAPQELDELISYTLQHEPDFRNSEIISPSGDPGVTDYSHRRSRVLMDLGKHENVILGRIRGVLPRVLDQLGMEEFPVTHTEAQITASNDGDFFGAHCDDSQELIASRRLTFVYFFHGEPRPFEGGELRLHDSRGVEHHAGSYQSVVPQQNQIVFFPCSVVHEITPVNCPSRAFADSRFTLNGWLHH